MAMSRPSDSIQTATIPSLSKLFDDRRVWSEPDICDSSKVGRSVDLLNLLQGRLVEEGVRSEVVRLIDLVESIHNTLTDQHLVDWHSCLRITRVCMLPKGTLAPANDDARSFFGEYHWMLPEGDSREIRVPDGQMENSKLIVALLTAHCRILGRFWRDKK